MRFATCPRHKALSARRTHCARPKPALQGFTLVEGMTVLALIAVLASWAAPSWKESLAEWRLRSRSQALVDDWQLARQLAVLHGENVTVSPVPAEHCYTLHRGDGSGCRCTSQSEASAQCAQGSVLLKATHWPSAHGIELENTNKSLVFEPSFGAVVPGGTWTFSNARGQRLSQVISPYGRVRVCAEPTAMGPHKAC